jgi:hypothetical protein
VPASPNASTSGVVSSGPSANPALPPTENRLIPLPRCSRDASPANFAPSGWNAATPRPLTTTAAAVSPYDGAGPASAIPVPARNSPPGISHGRANRSDSTPNTGCTTEEPIVEASTSAPSAA